MSERANVHFGYINAETREPRPPQPKQLLAHQSVADELFYGGAAGGGKSEYLIVEAVKTMLMHPRVEGALFRLTLKDLEQSLIIRFRDLVDPRLAKFVGGDVNCARFWNGSLLWFCYCARDADVYRYQSAQWVFLGIDEASHHSEFRFNYLTTRVRTVRPTVRKRIRLGSNPGNVGHIWLKGRYITPNGPDLGGRPTPRATEIWRPSPPVQKPWLLQRTRQFIPAKLQDNPALQEADPLYIHNLYSQHGALAQQLAEGDWDAWDGMLLRGWRDSHTVLETDVLLQVYGLQVGQTMPWHVVPPRPGEDLWRPPPTAKIYGSVDYGYSAPWSFHLHATLPGGHVRTFFEYYKPGKRDEEQARMIRYALETLRCSDGSPLPRPEFIVLDPSMGNARTEHGIAKSIYEVYLDILPSQMLILGAAGRGARVARVQRWNNALATAADGLPWWTVTTACPDLIRTVPWVPPDPLDKEVEDDKSENHAYEDTGRFLLARPEFPRISELDPLKSLDWLSRQHQEARAKRHRPTKGSPLNMEALS